MMNIFLFCILILQQVNLSCQCEANVERNCLCDNNNYNYDYHLVCPSISSKIIDVEVQRRSSVFIICNSTSSPQEVYENIKQLRFDGITRIKLQDCPQPNSDLHDVFKTIGINHVELLVISHMKRFETRKIQNLPITSLEFNYLDKLKIEDDSLNDQIRSLKLNNIEELQLTTSTFKSLTLVRRIHIHKSNFTPEESSFDMCNELSHLSLRGNGIKSLPENVFNKLDSLQQLSLSDNLLEDIPQTIFTNNKLLRHLSLANNNLKTLPPGVFQSNVQLQNVNFDDNCLEDLPQGLFSHQENLTKFRMINSRKTCTSKLNFPRQAFNSSHLQTIQMSRVAIGDISPHFLQGCQNLKELTIQRGGIKSLQEDLFTSTPQIRHIDFAGNELAGIPSKLFTNLANLKVLRLHLNQIHEISLPSFMNTQNLVHVELQHNVIEYIEDEFFANFAHLKKIDLSENRLQRFPSFQRNLKLEEASLSQNLISSINLDNILQLEGIQHLSLDGNQLSGYLNINLKDFVPHKFEIDLRNNQLHGVNLTEHKDRETLKNIELKLRFNPLKCDCYASPLKYVGDFICEDGNSLQEKTQENLVCPAQMINMPCQDKCQCFVNNYNKYVKLHCAGNNIKDLEEVLGQYHSYNIDLHLESWESDHLDVNITDNSMASIQLSDCNLKHLHLVSNNLTKLILARSNIQHVSEETVQSLVNKTHLHLKEVSFECSCDNKMLFNLLTDHSKIDAKNVTFQCNSQTKGSDLRTLTIADLCTEQALLHSLLLVTLIVFIISITLGIVIFIKQDIILIYIFSTSWGKYILSEDQLDKDKPYDVFISYAHQDSSFVEYQLVPGLETPVTSHDVKFKCLIHSRDWVPGQSIPDQILNSVEDSRKTVIVLSKNYLSSMWSNMEFNTAHNKALKERNQVCNTNSI